jgi:hypothetical protein
LHGAGIDVPRRQKVMLPQYRRLWSSHDLLGKAVEWHEVYDRPPTSSEWNSWHPHHYKNLALGVDRIERFYAGEWPFTSSVIGPRYRRAWKTSWNRFLETAGFTPLPHNYHYVTDDYGKAIRIDGKRLIHSTTSANTSKATALVVVHTGSAPISCRASHGSV